MKNRYPFCPKNCFRLSLLIALAFHPSFRLFAQASPEILWEKTFGGNGKEYLTAFIETTEGGYVLGGSSTSHPDERYGPSDYRIVKIDVTGNKEWEKSFGGDGAESLQEMHQTSDGGFILLGTSTSRLAGDNPHNIHGNSDYWLLKLDAKGNKVWDKVLAGDWGFDINGLFQVSDGGFVLAGYIKNNSEKKDSAAQKEAWTFGNSDFWVLKLSADGNKGWQKTYGGDASDEYLRNFKPTKDGGFILSGNTVTYFQEFKEHPPLSDWNYKVIKIDGAGNKIWDKTFGGQYTDELQDILATRDGGCLLNGQSDSFNSPARTPATKDDYYFWLIKLDSKGHKSWDRSIGVKYDDLTMIRQGSDGGYILAGTRYAPDHTRDYWVTKLDKRGNKLWERTFGGNSHENLEEILETKDQGFVLAGSSRSGISGQKSQAHQQSQNAWVVKIDRKGNLRWEKTLYGGNGSLAALIQDRDNNLLVGGQSAFEEGDGIVIEGRQPGGDDYWVVKLQPEAKKGNKKLKMKHE